MVNRWIGILSACCAILATSEILRRDVLSEWLADQSPPSPAMTLQPGGEHLSQVGIFDGDNRELGRSWTRSARVDTGDLVLMTTMTVLGPVQLPSGLRVPRLHIETDVQYLSGRQRVDKLTFSVHGFGVPIALHAEAAPGSRDFSCDWQLGEEKGTFLSKTPAALGDAIRPLDRLPNLYVGQSWRLDLLNPLAHMVPGADEDGLEFDHVIVRVTRMEKIEHKGQLVETFVVESGPVTAWVDHTGQVLRQVVRNVPMLGTLILVDETYSAEQRHKAERLAPRE